MTQEYFCRRQCCHYYVRPYPARYSYAHHHRPPSWNGIRKAGSFVFDGEQQKTLLVQSRGLMWGPPKGSLNLGETPLECACREVREETGLDLMLNDRTPSVTLSKSLFYLTEMPECAVAVQTHPNDLDANDANGIGWFSVNCLKELVETGELAINQPCRALIERVFHIHIDPNDPFYSNRARGGFRSFSSASRSMDGPAEQEEKEQGQYPQGP